LRAVLSVQNERAAQQIVDNALLQTQAQLPAVTRSVPMKYHPVNGRKSRGKQKIIAKQLNAVKEVLYSNPRSAAFSFSDIFSVHMIQYFIVKCSARAPCLFGRDWSICWSQCKVVAEGFSKPKFMYTQVYGKVKSRAGRAHR
jgi:hypothetical protein